MRRIRGQGSSEWTLLISVVVLSVLAASSTIVPLFRDGVTDLGEDVKSILSDGAVGGTGGRGGYGQTNASTANSAVFLPGDASGIGSDMSSNAAPIGADPDIGPPVTL
jgi:hypothetical protein